MASWTLIERVDSPFVTHLAELALQTSRSPGSRRVRACCTESLNASRAKGAGWTNITALVSVDLRGSHSDRLVREVTEVAILAG